ncbi:DUF4231 domain-containing protein [Micromonospora sp. NPDC049900]|uniref:DUF4231 domain-containing protein n=1 Tax=Micromonospora sp. NPDC049900 TaxID=3364275 RepID=UPI00379E10E9
MIDDVHHGLMRWFGHRESGVSRSESGLYELVGRRSDLPLSDAIVHFRDLVSADIDWADSRKIRYRRALHRVRIASLVLAAASTVALGIDGFDQGANLALPMVATVTVLGALEGVFGWRSRLAMMEETRYRLNRLRDEMDYYLTVTPSEEMTRTELDRFFAEQQTIWRDVSQRWTELRAMHAPPPANSTASPGANGA